MANALTDYLVGDKGVDLVASPLHTPDGGLLSAQNVEFIRTFGIGGIGTRGGLAAINSTPAAGAIVALANVPIDYPKTLDLIIGLNSGETPTWLATPDGSSYASLLSTLLPKVQGITKNPTFWGGAVIPLGIRIASYKNQLFYPGDNYILYPTANHTAPPFVVYTGTIAFEQFRVPTNATATAGSHPFAILDVWIDNGVIYLAVYDSGGVAPDLKGRVLAFDPTNGELVLIGNRFGNGSGENGKGTPFCLTSYLGQIWAGTWGSAGNNQGAVYRIQVGIDETWTADHTATVHNGYYTSLASYRGKLYASTDADAAGTAIVEARSSSGAWSTSLTAPVGNVSYFAGLTVFNDHLFVCFYKQGSTVLIKVFDGTSWTTDVDVKGTYAEALPGAPYVFSGKLYWPFIGNAASDTDTTGFLLQRTSGGVWTRVLNARGLRGALGQVVTS